MIQHLRDILSFDPIFKEKIWGGRNLETTLDKKLPDDKLIGESWEISSICDNYSVVSSGLNQNKSLPELIETFGVKLLGKYIFEKYSKNFPLLLKYLDVSADLSIQVHPNDTLAQKNYSSFFGKTEAWFVVSAKPGAKISCGLKKDISEAEFKQHVKQNTFNEILCREEVQAGDLIFVPAGTIHYLEAGLVILEIQQSSDITFRISDFNRLDIDGNLRELHIAEALAVSNLKASTNGIGKIPYQLVLNKVNNILDNDFFKINIVYSDGITVRDYSNIHAFIILVCLEGQVDLISNNTTIDLKKGKSVLVTADTKDIQFFATNLFKVIEITIK